MISVIPNDVETRRLTPRISLLSNDYLSVRPVIQWLENVAVGRVSGRMLDLGCGNRPYRPLFLPHIREYVGADVTQNSTHSVDMIIPSSGLLPSPPNSFDTVLSTQVLEHVSEPQVYLQEVARVLKPGGVFVLTCPASYMLHEEPYDFYRYTEYGIRYLLDKYGLEIQQLDTAGGAWRLMGQIFINHKVFAKKFRIPIVTGIFHFSWIFTANVICEWLDGFNMNPKDTTNYMVIAVKRGGQ